MKITIRSALIGAALIMTPVLTTNFAQAEEPVWTKGEITKVDKEQGKVTVRHEEIENLDMPAMRMIFRVADPKMLDDLEAGQKGEFYFVDENGRMLIKQIK